jgi:RND family efflux transporter MFP subunit
LFMLSAKKQTHAVDNRCAARGFTPNPMIVLAVILPAFASLTGSAQSARPVATGITEPFLDTRLSAPSDGILTVKKFKEGDSVKAGDVILELDKRLEELEVERRRAVMEQKKIEWDSTAKLYVNSKSVAKEELDKKETEYKVAAREYDIAQEQVRRRLVIAPFDGVITEIYHQVGEACESRQTQDPLARLVDTKRCFFVSNLDAKAAANLKLGQAAQLEIDTGNSTMSVTGKVSFISPVVDAASGLVKVKVQFDNADGKIRPGLAAKLVLE